MTGKFLHEAAQRKRKILAHRNFLLASALGLSSLILSLWTSPLAPVKRTLVSELASGVLAIAGFGFSVSLAAVAVIVALPRSRLLLNMLETQDPPSSTESVDTPFSDLVFLFTWTGAVQAVAAGVTLSCMAVAGQSEILTTRDVPGLLCGAVLTFIATYALAQLVTAIITLSLVAKLQAAYLQSDTRRS